MERILPVEENNSCKSLRKHHRLRFCDNIQQFQLKFWRNFWILMTDFFDLAITVLLPTEKPTFWNDKENFLKSNSECLVLLNLTLNQPHY